MDKIDQNIFPEEILVSNLSILIESYVEFINFLLEGELYRLLVEGVRKGQLYCFWTDPRIWEGL